MSYEIYHLLDEWSLVFYKRKEKFVQLAQQMLNQRQDSFFIRGDVEIFGKINMRVRVEVDPNGSIYFSGRALLPEHPNHFIRYVCLVKCIEGDTEIVVAEESVFLFENGYGTTAAPSLKVADTLKEMAAILFEKKEAVSLSKEALAELLLIQQSVLMKERDTEGLMKLQEDYHKLIG